MTDDYAIEGDDAGYVPCFELPAVLVVEEEGAISGHAGGRVPRDNAAGALPAPERAAIVGSGVGFVAKPCECEATSIFVAGTHLSGVVNRFDSWIGQSVDGAAPVFSNPTVPEAHAFTPFVRVVWYGPLGGPTVGPPETETSQFYSHDKVNTPPYNGQYGHLIGQVLVKSGNESPDRLIDWTLYIADWGAGPPSNLNPGGTVLASGSQMALQADATSTDIDLVIPWIPPTGRFQLYLRVDSPRIADGEVGDFSVWLGDYYRWYNFGELGGWTVEVCGV